MKCPNCDNETSIYAEEHSKYNLFLYLECEQCKWYGYVRRREMENKK